MRHWQVPAVGTNTTQTRDRLVTQKKQRLCIWAPTVGLKGGKRFDEVMRQMIGCDRRVDFENRNKCVSDVKPASIMTALSAARSASRSLSANVQPAACAWPPKVKQRLQLSDSECVHNIELRNAAQRTCTYVTDNCGTKLGRPYSSVSLPAISPTMPGCVFSSARTMNGCDRSSVALA